ncbi:glucosaminylphosphatidylinositol acyltransferase [Acrasis kona]|uniref:Glucosaminylphosphatidylinositol acyltransferase n=1 Tax=Acrasis kona TaxID=1008807 RepID=A0AAW2YJH1_9EUKA
MDVLDIKDIKERFVTGGNGTTMTEILSIALVCPAIVLLDRSVKSLVTRCIGKQDPKSSFKLTLLWWFIEIFTRLVPLVLTQSSLLLPTTKNASDHTIVHFPQLLLLLYATIVISYFATRRSYTKEKDVKVANLNVIPFFTEYRSTMMLATAVAILAVDFPVLFPRRIAKTESWGASLMDMGVGSFVFSGSLVSQAARSRSVPPSLIKTIRHNIPLLLLAGGRFFSVSMTNYQTHVGEYGTHWNFFMTLMVVSITVDLIDAIFKKSSTATYFATGIGLCILQQTLLSMGMQNYIESAPRVNLFSANKEGICSTLGYVSVYYIGVGLGRFVFETQRKSEAGDENAWKSFSYKMIIVSIALVVTSYFSFSYFIDLSAKLSIDQGLVDLSNFSTFSHQVPGFHRNYLSNIFIPSRAMNNFGYVLWTLTYNVGLLTIFSVMYTWLLPKQQEQSPEAYSCMRDAVNTNQLATFLIANLSTGAINLAIVTVFWNSAVASFFVVLLYLQAVTLVMTILHYKKIIIKL